MLNVSGLRRYSHSPPNITDEDLAFYMEAAQVWLENAEVARLPNNALYELAVYMLATHWMDNKGVIAEGNNVQHTPLSVFSIMHQLRGIPGSEAAKT